MKISVIRSDSSNIDSMAYSIEDTTLTVKFLSGAIYTYSGVGVDVFVALMTAESAGKAFASLIKDQYPYFRYDTVAGNRETAARLRQLS